MGEKPIKYFLNLEKHHYSQKTITKLILEDGHTVTYNNDILWALTEYYQCLFTSNPNVTGKPNLDPNLLPKISEECKKALDKLYTMDEMETAMKAKAKGKVPGIDGYGIELLQAFWSEVSGPLLQVINYSLKAGKLHNMAQDRYI